MGVGYSEVREGCSVLTNIYVMGYISQLLQMFNK